MTCKERKIVSNKAKCKCCNTIIESHHRHDFKWCKCKAIAVDGGKDYIRRVGELDTIVELSTYEGDIEDEGAF